MSFSMFLTNVIAIILMSYTINTLLPQVHGKYTVPVLYLYIIFVGAFAGKFIGFYSTPFFLLGILIILYISGGSFRLWNMLLSLIAWMWNVLSSYIGSFVFSTLGYSYTYTQLSNYQPWILLIITIIFSCIPAFFFGKWLRVKLTDNPDLIPRPMLYLLFGEVVICTCIFLLNIVWGSIIDFPAPVLIFSFSLFTALAFANLLIYINTYRTAQENQRLALHAQALQSLSEYTQKLEKNYKEMRRFRHDYMNMLATLRGYILERDWNKLESYFDTKIMNNSGLLNREDTLLGKLSNMKVLEIKGILYTKIIEAFSHNIYVSLEMTDEISRIDTDLLSLSRLLGIYLDNALEAAMESEARELSLVIYQKSNSIFIHIENSTPPLQAPLSQLSKEGFTSKVNHTGIGLFSAQLIVKTCPNLYVFTEYTDNTFKEKIMIQNREVQE